MTFIPNLFAIKTVMKNKGYEIFSNPDGYDLNIVGIRTNDNQANTFNDWITCFYEYGNMTMFSAWPATTDPGTYWRLHPMNVKGTAIMKPGQYLSAYQIGKHNNYWALVNTGKTPVSFYRDNNKDGILNTKNMPIESAYVGLNIHRASATSKASLVDRWSAGCQVFQSVLDFEFFMNMCYTARAKYGNFFTYTLLEEVDFK